MYKKVVKINIIIIKKTHLCVFFNEKIKKFLDKTGKIWYNFTCNIVWNTYMYSIYLERDKI